MNILVVSSKRIIVRFSTRLENRTFSTVLIKLAGVAALSNLPALIDLVIIDDRLK